jgi:branched-chain amino acid transport system substrate-binding protein
MKLIQLLKSGPVNILIYMALIFPVISFSAKNYITYDQQDKQPQQVKIGILIPDIKSDAAVQGAELAIRLANDAGGFRGSPFRLAIRSMEGPWGTGSKQAINLIFEEKVWALLGSHDGRNAHLVEQASTKSTVVFVSAWSGDPTLSQAFVPWFFNCVPNDFQQAEVLFEHIYKTKKANKVAVVSDNNYDSEMALRNFLRIIKTENINVPEQYIYDNYKGKLNLLADHIKENGTTTIILFCQPSSSVEVIKQLRKKQLSLPLYGPLFLLNENELSAEELLYLCNNIMIPSDNWSLSKYSLFRKEYIKAYNQVPGMVATYAFDATNILIEAIKIAGTPEREKIQTALENTDYEGVTGHILFDDKGNRYNNFSVSIIKDGVPTVVK